MKEKIKDEQNRKFILVDKKLIIPKEVKIDKYLKADIVNKIKKEKFLCLKEGVHFDRKDGKFYVDNCISSALTEAFDGNPEFCQFAYFYEVKKLYKFPSKSWIKKWDEYKGKGKLGKDDRLKLFNKINLEFLTHFREYDMVGLNSPISLNRYDITELMVGLYKKDSAKFFKTILDGDYKEVRRKRLAEVLRLHKTTGKGMLEILNDNSELSFDVILGNRESMHRTVDFRTCKDEEEVKSLILHKDNRDLKSRGNAYLTVLENFRLGSSEGDYKRLDKKTRAALEKIYKETKMIINKIEESSIEERVSELEKQLKAR